MSTESLPRLSGSIEDLELPSDERAAFAELFTRYFAPVYRYVYSRVPMAEEARDIVHLVFYRIWTRRPQFEPGRSVLPFLYTVARFATVDYLRHERIEHRFARHCLRMVELEGPPSATDDPEREVLHAELSTIVSQALDGLSDRQREVMTMRWREQLSYDEIARRLGISKKTVAMHLTRGMEHLRQTLPGMYDIE